MSRTYRRLKGDQHHWRRGADNEWWIRNTYPDLPFEDASKKMHARFHSDNGWTMSTPSYWVREYMTKPQRANVRALIHKVHTLSLDDAGELMFPLAKKPHEYYW